MSAEARHCRPVRVLTDRAHRRRREAADRARLHRVSEHLDATVAALRQGGLDVSYQRYPGVGHAFSAAWADSMATTIALFRQHL